MEQLETEAQIAAMERERQIEMEMSGLGRDRFIKNVDEAKRQGHETTTPGARAVLAATVEPLAEAIAVLTIPPKGSHGSRKAKREGGPVRANSRPPKAVKFLRQTSPKVAAFIISRVILDNLTIRRSLQQVAMQIAAGIEDECRFTKFAEEKPHLFEAIFTNLNDRNTGMDWKRTVLIHSMTKADIPWEAWTPTDKLHLGQKCIELFIKTTGFAKVSRVNRGKNNTEITLDITPECSELIVERNGRCELLSPNFMPTIVPPQPWSGPHTGGYWFLPKRTPFVKHVTHEYIAKLNACKDQMKDVYEAVNIMQAVAWRINLPVFNTMREVWDRRLPHGGLDFLVEQPMPLCPRCHQSVNTEKRDHTCFKDKEVHVTWKRQASKVYYANSRARSKQLQVAKVIWVAEKYAAEEALYFPMTLDFRGRVYCLPMFLNPQGADWAKGLLTFSKGKPINDERALGWLMIHGANTYGFDKVSLQDRIGWVEEHEREVLACAEDPLSNLFWSDADKPWQFLAFCFEYAAFKREGFGYVSSLPVALDGSCNGLQHFSAMLRDPVGGKAVNLVPSEEPQDIYQTVCDRVIVKLKAETATEQAAWAKQWLVLNPDRSLTKRPVMVLPYGGTMFSCREYVIDWLGERKDCPWPDDALFGPATYMAKLIWTSIGEVVVAARQAMDWLQKAARAAAANGKAVEWTTPDGFPVMQAYQEMATRAVDTVLGERIQLVLRTPTEKLDKRRQANGISPNFVHSMDATALRLYVLLAWENGVDSFALVHDSYGTLAADTDISAACLREAFVNMYAGVDHLSSFKNTLVEAVEKPETIPPTPVMGELDMEQVRHAEYFFA